MTLNEVIAHNHALDDAIEWLEKFAKPPQHPGENDQEYYARLYDGHNRILVDSGEVSKQIQRYVNMKIPVIMMSKELASQLNLDERLSEGKS